QEQAEVLLALSQEHGFRQWIAAGVFLRGWALTQRGLLEEGIAQLQEGHRAWLAIGNELGKTQILARLAEVYGHAGRPDKGLDALAEALVAMDKNAERHYAADIYRLRGELLLQQAQEQQGPYTIPRATQREAEVHIQRAREIAQHQHAKFQEL